MAERQVSGGGGALRGVARLSGALLLCLACATAGGGDGGPEALLRLEVPAAVGWEPGGPFALALRLHNAAGHTLSLARPRAEAAQVTLSREGDGRVACRTPSPSRGQREGSEIVSVRGSSDVPLQVDVGPYCRDLAPGVYRYEVVFVANPAQGGAGLAYAGTLGPRGGRVAIGAGLSRDPAALAAALGTPAP